MAQVPDAPSPAVGPSTAQLPFQQINAPRAAFAASVLGDAANNLGQAATQIGADLGQHAQAMAAVDNKLATDEAIAAYSKTADDVALDMQQNARGLKAVEALPSALKTLDSQREAIASKLTNPTAKAMFLGDSRMLAVRAAGSLSRFASAQREEALDTNHVAFISSLMNDNAKYPNDPVTFAENAKRGLIEAAFFASRKGLSEEAAAQYGRDTYGKLVDAQVKTLFNNGMITQADSFLEEHKDGMNPTAYNQLKGTLRPALFANDAATVADQVVAESLGTRAPKADVSQTLAAMRADPIAAIKAATGITVPTAYGARDAARNKAVGGSATSEHLVNAAWDLQPPKGMTMVQLAQRIHDSGIPYDQLEIKGNHVHVGFKPDGVQRGELIGDKALVAQIHNPSINSAVGGAMTSYQIEARAGIVQDTVRAKMLERYPGNMQLADMAVSRAMTQLNQIAGARRDTENQGYQTLAATIAANSIEDEATLLKIPGMAPLYNMLPESARKTLGASMTKIANTPTLENQAEKQRMLGLLYDPSGHNTFLQTDLSSIDLTAKDRASLMTTQMKLRKKDQQELESDKLIRYILGSPQAAETLKQLHVTPTSKNAVQFRGAVAEQVRVWSARNDNTVPQGKDIAGIMQAAQTQMLVDQNLPTTASIASGLSSTPAPGLEAVAQEVMAEATARGLKITIEDARAIAFRRQNRGR